MISRDAGPSVPRHAVGDRLSHEGRAAIPKLHISRERIRVGVVDDHPTVLASIGAAIAGSDDLRLVAFARTMSDAIDLADRVDVLVCDMNLGQGAEGIHILRAIHDPRRARHAEPPALLFLSGFGHPSLIRAALDGGAAGYLDKTAETSEILDAVRTLHRGGTAYSAAALQGSRDARRRPSAREIQVLELIVSGATNAEIGVGLTLSEKTVESHLRRLFDRYGLLSRTELAVVAIDEGWVAAPRLRT